MRSSYVQGPCVFSLNSDRRHFAIHSIIFLHLSHTLWVAHPSALHRQCYAHALHVPEGRCDTCVKGVIGLESTMLLTVLFNYWLGRSWMKYVKVTLQSTVNLHLMLFWDIARVICLLLFLQYSIHSFVNCANIKKREERDRERDEEEEMKWKEGGKYECILPSDHPWGLQDPLSIPHSFKWHCVYFSPTSSVLRWHTPLCRLPLEIF